MLALSGTDNFKHVEVGDFVISLRSFEGGFEYSAHKGCVSPAYTVLRPKLEIDGSFWRHLFKSEVFKQMLAVFNVGIRDGKSIRYDDFSKFTLALPSLTEQLNLSSYLDRETARLDGLIAKKSRFIDLLREKCQALITHAVTNGLDPDVKMKDSGVEWLGEVPEHWAVKRLRYNVTLNPSIKSGLLPNTEVSFLPMEAIGVDGSINLERSRLVADVCNGYSYFEEGDLAFAKVTPCFENGKGAIMHGLVGGVGFGTTELTVLRPNKEIDLNFISHVLKSDRFRSLGTGAMTGAGGLKRVPDEFTRNFESPWPEIHEQRMIAKHLEREIVRIDKLIDKTESSIELLKERRSALITAAVTGQIDVRERTALQEQLAA
jgi:type I restriction enzyme S subunit